MCNQTSYSPKFGLILVSPGTIHQISVIQGNSFPTQHIGSTICDHIPPFARCPAQPSPAQERRPPCVFVIDAEPLSSLGSAGPSGLSRFVGTMCITRRSNTSMSISTVDCDSTTLAGILPKYNEPFLIRRVPSNDRTGSTIRVSPTEPGKSKTRLLYYLRGYISDSECCTVQKEKRKGTMNVRNVFLPHLEMHS